MQSLDESNVGAPVLELILSDGSVHNHKGYLVNFNAAVDPTTGTLTLEADFPNPERLILPRPVRQSSRRCREARKRDALLVPQRAVIETAGNFPRRLSSQMTGPSSCGR